MPRIKLIKKNGTHAYAGTLYEAGKEYEVDEKTANYLVIHTNVAEEIGREHLTTPSYISKPKTSTLDSIGKLKIALVRLGGIGDSLLLTVLARAVRRKYPDSYITLYVRDRAGYDIVINHLCVDRVVITGNLVWKDFVESLEDKEHYDIIYDCRYVCKVIYKKEHTTRHGKFGEEKQRTDKLFEPYKKLYYCFPLACNEVCNNAGIDEFEMSLSTAGLEGGSEDLRIYLDKSDLAMIPLIDSDNYVTIHNGADVSRQTKCWATESWVEVAEYLKSLGYKVIQLGGRFEEVVDGAINMIGKTTLSQCAGIISKAKFHIDTEGGLVHIARAVGTRSIVLFGPTPVQFFGYKENINIEPAIDCKGCWWTTDFWWRDCPKGFPLPTKCMESITAQRVFEAIQEIEKMPKIESNIDMNDINEQFAQELILDENHYKSEPHQYDRVESMMSLCKGKTVLEVGAGDGYCAEVLKRRGFEVTATEISQIRLQRMKDKGINAVYADVNDLPFADNSFDSVICGEVLEHIDSMGKGLQELERVCKPDGKIIVSLPIHQRYDGIEMHLWAIRTKMVLYEGKNDLMVMTLERINRK